MNSTIPADLLELKARFEKWRANRKYMREPISDELWAAAAALSFNNFACLSTNQNFRDQNLILAESDR